MEQKGFYIILFACALLIGTVSIVNHTLTAPEDGFDDQAWQDAIAKSGIAEPAEASAGPTGTPEPSAAPAATPTPAPTDPPVSQPTMAAAEEDAVAVSAANDTPPQLRNPVVGGITKEYSVDDLVYSETMNDWRTHNGLDIAAELGAQVKAAADGVVEQVYEDDLLGVVVVIGHTGNTKTLYANLQNLDFIEVGKEVKQGDIIGGVGNSATAEIAEQPHLHFEVLVNKENVDPKQYLTA